MIFGKYFVVNLFIKKKKVMKLFEPNHSDEFTLDCKDSAIQTMVIELFRSNGMKVYENTIEYDPEYPYLVWDNMLTQSLSPRTKHLSLENFLKEFYNHYKKEIELNEKYKAVVDGLSNTVQVGCQTIPFSKIEDVYHAIQEAKTFKKDYQTQTPEMG